ncbi:malonyl-ACP O-methyltransferase BioC [Haliea sp. E17]|uniref:malonyl-ACP O-methyltransferase BioC n=1 Tax=Haliea sp. E17 TaxID=3401576 RepID=UPI003AB06219
MIAEYLPSSAASGPELVLLHGWANSREVWRPLLARLRSWANVTLLELPGLAPGRQSAPSSSDDLVAEMARCCPPRAVYVGWSLGGEIAEKFALTNPERLAGLVTLASNPRFVAEGSWPGMAPGTFAGFREAAAQSPRGALRRFDALQAAGSRHSRQLLRQVAASRGDATDEAPLAGLDWLAELDTRDVLPQLAVPQLHLLAANDALVPAGLAGSLQQLLISTPDAAVEVLPESSHLLPLEHSEWLAGRLRSACAAWGLLEPVAHPTQALDKRDVAASFSRAATHYDSMARLQRDVGEALLERGGLPHTAVQEVLDLGCGTGFFCSRLRERYPAASYTGLDIAEGMARYARDQQPPDTAWLVADAEALPLAAGSMDLVFSSLAIQWCLSPTAWLAELARVLRPGGRCVFTTLGPATLHELRTAWSAVDGHQHVNEFLPAAALEQAAGRIPGVRLNLSTRMFRMEYDGVRDLLLELKGIGAHNVNQGRPAGLTAPAALRRMMTAYEQFREAGRLPASYEVIFGELEKT